MIVMSSCSSSKTRIVTNVNMTMHSSRGNCHRNEYFINKLYVFKTWQSTVVTQLSSDCVTVVIIVNIVLHDDVQLSCIWHAFVISLVVCKNAWQHDSVCLLYNCHQCKWSLKKKALVIAWQCSVVLKLSSWRMTIKISHNYMLHDNTH